MSNRNGRNYRQRDATDCGPACLNFIAGWHRVYLSVSQLRRWCGTDQTGTTALGLIAAAKQLGFSAKGVKGVSDALPKVPLPAIAHCLVDQRRLHYVVLVKWTAKYAEVMDPVLGRVKKWPHDRFPSIWTGVLILVAPSDSFQSGDHVVSPFRRLWRLLRPHRPVVSQALVGAVFSTILALATSIYVQKIVDVVIPDGNRQLLNLLGVAMLAVLGFKLVLGIGQSLLSLRTAQRIDAALILGYYRHLLGLPQAFFDTMRVGEITSRVGDAVKIRNFLNTAMLNVVLNPLILAFALIAMFFYSAKLALLSLVLVPANAALYWFINLRNRSFQREMMERGADFDAQLVSSLHAQPVIRRFQLEARECFKTETRLVRLLKTGWGASIAAMGAGTAGTFITSGYLIALLWLGADLVLQAGLTPGELMSCYTLAGYLTGPITSLLGLNSSVQEALIATERLFEIMDLELEVDRGTIAFGPDSTGDIRFEGVSFGHAGRAAVLHDVTLTLPARGLTVVTGPSGCGKSTLLALIQRLYMPSAGRIYIGDIDTCYFQLSSLRRHLAVVPQQTHLLSGTVLENLAPGDAEPDLQRLLQISREVGALEFIEKLPQGFFTFLTEDGANLSGGQRQRLALVRALYLAAPIVLLDEPASALDAAAEASLVRLLAQLRDAGKTIIVAAHGGALLAAADHIVRMQQGRVVAVGSGETIMLQPGAA